MPKFRVSILLCSVVTLLLCFSSASAQAMTRLPGDDNSGPGIAGATYVHKVWAACGRTTSDKKIVRTFDRFRADAGGHFMPGGKSNLLCGNLGFGYRHIAIRHLQEWEQTTFLTHNNWRDVADFAIATVLIDPDKVTYEPRNDTFCFSRLIYLNDKRTGSSVDTRIPNVVVSATNQRIITAIPAKSPCK